MFEECQICGIPHNPEWPHDPTTLQYQTWFQNETGLVPTWADAMRHCPQEVRESWRDWLKQGYGIDPDAPAEMLWGRGR